MAVWLTKTTLGDRHGHYWLKKENSTDAAFYYACKKCGIGGYGAPNENRKYNHNLILMAKVYEGLTCDECKVCKVMVS
jgi:hypothetical protein